MSDDQRRGQGLSRGSKELFVVGDRVLVHVREGTARTEVGLLLPASAVEKEQIQSGRVVAIGPGTPLPPPGTDDEEPWRAAKTGPRYLKMEIEVGDEIVFHRRAAVEVSFEGTKYLVVPHGAILVLVREANAIPDTLPDHL